MQITEDDQKFARTVGIDLEDARLKAVIAERDFALETLDQAIEQMQAARAATEHWRECWIWTFGFLMVLILILAGTLVEVSW